jgi:hypothetical protein
MGKRHVYQGQMKNVTPHGITGLERVKNKVPNLQGFTA